MAKHYIDVFSFQFWHGQPPRTVQYQGESFTRVGQPIVGKIMTGKRGLPFECETAEDFVSYAYAMAFIPLYHALPFTGPKRVIYNQIDYLTTYNHLYFIDHVDVVECKAMPRLIGPDYDFPGGARMRVKWQMTPFFIEPEPET
jgi:hypothetical protein